MHWNKLKNKGISCININRINVCGQIKTVVLDKTGTLTEDSISVNKCEIYDGKAFMPSVHPPDEISIDSGIWFSQKKYQKFKNSHTIKFAEWIASSHSVTLYKDSPIGDILEVEMFRTSQWIMMENDAQNEDDQWGNLLIPKAARAMNKSKSEDNLSHFEMLQIHKFDFSSEMQRMSVIGKPNYDNMYVWYTKGAPEQIKKLCTPESLPQDFDEVLMNNTCKGKRVIALAYKYLPNFEEEGIENIHRDEVEHSLTFLGFLVMSNNIKPHTRQSIDELKEGILIYYLIYTGAVKPIMATGDNLLTSVSVSFKCNILENKEYYSWEIDDNRELYFIRKDGYSRIEEISTFLLSAFLNLFNRLEYGIDE